MGNGFANQCGGVVVSEISGGFFLVLVVGFSWWLSAWVSLGVSCGGCFFVVIFFFWRNFCGCCW